MAKLIQMSARVLAGTHTHTKPHYAEVRDSARSLLYTMELILMRNACVRLFEVAYIGTMIMMMMIMVLSYWIEQVGWGMWEMYGFLLTDPTSDRWLVHKHKACVAVLHAGIGRTTG